MTIILVTHDSCQKSRNHALTSTLTESLWRTVKDNSSPIALREPALIELARRKDPSVLAYCDHLLRSEGQEEWLTALNVLETLNTYDAAQRLLVLCGTSSQSDRRIVLNYLAHILNSSQREGFRRILRRESLSGVLDVTDWTPTALRVLEQICTEKGIQPMNIKGKPLVDLSRYFTNKRK